MATYSMGIAVPDAFAAPAPVPATGSFDDRYNAATTDAQKQAIVAERDAANAATAAEYDAWHKARGTGPYATSGSGAGTEDSAYEIQQRQTASAFLQGILKLYGLGALAGSVDSLINEWGTNTDLIALKLKETEPYKVRFKGLIGLQQRGITDVRNEAEYLNLETQYRQAFREVGLKDFLGQTGTQAEFDAIGDLVGKFSLSVNEVRDRISDAQRAAVDTPLEVKQALAEFYGVDGSRMVEWSLDPEKTMNQINRQVNAGMAGGLARGMGLGIQQGTSEGIADLFGNNDLTSGQISQQLQGAKAIDDATQRLAYIDNETLLADDSVNTSFGTNAASEKKVKTLQSRERSRFGGSSGFGAGSFSRNSGT